MQIIKKENKITCDAINIEKLEDNKKKSENCLEIYAFKNG